MSGLKVNFHKSLMVGVNIGDSWLTEATYILNCKVGKIMFLYLGLSIGGDPRKLAFWEHVDESIISVFHILFEYILFRFYLFLFPF